MKMVAKTNGCGRRVRGSAPWWSASKARTGCGSRSRAMSKGEADSRLLALMRLGYARRDSGPAAAESPPASLVSQGVPFAVTVRIRSFSTGIVNVAETACSGRDSRASKRMRIA
jgi:hypothetical protein